MKNNLTITIYSIIVIILGYLLFEVAKTNKDIINRNNQINKLQIQNDDKQYLINNLVVISKLQYFAEGRKINNLTLYDINKDSTSIKDLILNKRKLIYIFSEQSCSICYLQFLSQLKELSNIIGSDNIIIIGKYSSNRNFKLFISNNNIDQKIYRTDTNLNIFPEYNDYPMAFLLSNNMIIEKFIITDKSNIQLSNNYLKLIQKEFENEAHDN